MELENKTLLKVISELIGYTEPYGDTVIDQLRYENQEALIELLIKGVEELINNSEYRIRVEDSMNRIGERAYVTLEYLHQLIEEKL